MKKQYWAVCGQWEASKGRYASYLKSLDFVIASSRAEAIEK